MRLWGVHSAEAEVSRIARIFHNWCAAIARRLPFGLSKIVPATIIGFAIINGFTFSVDLALLWTLAEGMHWPKPLALAIAYTLAFALSFILNRTFNFQSHGNVGGQVGIYLVVVVINFVAFIVGLAWLLSLFLPLLVGRLLAGGCEAVYMYSAMRWVVFRDRSASAEPLHSAGQ